MPLIWNDDRMEFLENPADFDRTQYVIVRKLFLQFKEHVQNIGEQWIRDAFNEYGNIEMIEVFMEENRRTWAYLTYSNDDEAYRALTVATKVDKIDKILPADTWCQPSSFLCTPVENETVVVDALSKFEMAKCHNDRSDLLRKLLALSTKSNSELLKEALNNRILPSLKRFDFQLTDAINGTAISLSEIRSILRCIGPHIYELGIYFAMDKYPANIDRIFFKMSQYIAPNLNTIRLKSVPINQDWLRQLKPLLNRIECLVLAASNYDFDYDIDFQLYCPDLKTLKLSMNLNGALLSKKQPKLERISILHNQFMEERLVLEFMKNNPQLLYLKIEANDSNNLLKQIPLHLPKLEKLCLYQGYPDITADNLEHLTALKHLKRLKLMYMEPDEFNRILNCLPKFKLLQQLKLHVFYDGIDSAELDEIYCPNADAIVSLAQALTELECFHIRFCSIDAETLIDFIRNAKKIKVLGVYRCGLEITDTILESIETIRQAADPTLMVLYADKFHPELNTEKTFSTVKLVKL